MAHRVPSPPCMWIRPGYTTRRYGALRWASRSPRCSTRSRRYRCVYGINSLLTLGCMLSAWPTTTGHPRTEADPHPFLPPLVPPPTGYLQPVADPHPLLPLAQDEGQVQAGGEGVVRDGRIHPLTVSRVSALCLHFIMCLSYDLSLLMTKLL